MSTKKKWMIIGGVIIGTILISIGIGLMIANKESVEVISNVETPVQIETVEDTNGIPPRETVNKFDQSGEEHPQGGLNADGEPARKPINPQDKINADKPMEERLKEEGNTVVIGEHTPTDWYDEEVSQYLPVNPTDDPECEKAWKVEKDALNFMTLSPLDIECDNPFYFTTSSKTTDLDKFIPFMEKYLRRVTETGTQIKLSKLNMHYSFTLDYVHPDDYPETWEYNPAFDLLCVTFHLNGLN